MVIFDIGAAFVVAGGIGWRAQGRRRDLALVAATLGVGAPGLVFLELYPDWDWQYLLDPATLPPGVPAMFLAAIFVAAMVGHWVGSCAPKVWLGGLVVFGAYCIASLPRIPYVGTRAEFFADQAPLLPQPFLIVLGSVGSAALLVLVLCWRLAVRSRPADSTEQPST